MRKHLFSLTLALLMIAALLSGSLALYTTSLNVAEGGVVAKEFVFTGGGTDSFRRGVKIAPSETVAWTFSVRNFDGLLTAETDLYYKLTFRVASAAGKRAIEPLVVTVRDEGGAILGRVTGTGVVELLGAFPLSSSGQERFYTVECVWPADGPNDIAYAGGAFGSTVLVSAVASQAPLELSQPETPSEPEPEDPPEPGKKVDLAVRYATTEPWTNSQSGIYQFEFQVKITNNTDTAIEDWFMDFSMTDSRVIQLWNARFLGQDGDGTVHVANPAYNDVKTDIIQPGKTATFGGIARIASGDVTEPIGNIRVGGKGISPEDVTVAFEAAIGEGVQG